MTKIRGQWYSLLGVVILAAQVALGCHSTSAQKPPVGADAGSDVAVNSDVA